MRYYLHTHTADIPRKMIKLLEEISLYNYTLILPSVAVGNVGQLCVDLVISSLNLRKIGSVLSSAFLPVVGLNPYDDSSNSLCTTADFYIGDSAKLLLLQLRSPHVASLTTFFDELVQFVQQQKIAKAIILTSGYAYEQWDNSNRCLRFLLSDQLLFPNEKLFETLNWVKHERKDPVQSTGGGRLTIPGGGFANNLYDRFVAGNIPCALLFRYCSEGDNKSDALELTLDLNRWLNILETNSDGIHNVMYPPSWKYFFGCPPPFEIY